VIGTLLGYVTTTSSSSSIPPSSATTDATTTTTTIVTITDAFAVPHSEDGENVAVDTEFHKNMCALKIAQHGQGGQQQQQQQQQGGGNKNNGGRVEGVVGW